MKSCNCTPEMPLNNVTPLVIYCSEIPEMDGMNSKFELILSVCNLSSKVAAANKSLKELNSEPSSMLRSARRDS